MSELKVDSVQLRELGDVLVRLRNYPRAANYRARFADAGVDVPLAVRNVVRAIELLARGGDVSVGDVASQLALEASSASRQVDLAVRHGLVTKRPAEDDARRLALEMTAHGRELAALWEQRRQQHLADVLSAWSSDDVGRLLRLAGRLADDLDALEA